MTASCSAGTGWWASDPVRQSLSSSWATIPPPTRMVRRRSSFSLLEPDSSGLAICLDNEALAHAAVIFRRLNIVSHPPLPVPTSLPSLLADWVIAGRIAADNGLPPYIALATACVAPDAAYAWCC